MPPNTEQLIEELRQEFDVKIREHEHDGNIATQVKIHDIFGRTQELNTEAQTIATTGNTDWYIIAPFSGLLFSVDFSATDALSTSDTNYITFTITNLGTDGSGTSVMLSSDDENTTKATGGSAISADTKRSLVVGSNRGIEEGDRLKIRAATTGTLANTVTNSVYVLRFR